jgi:3-dehydroquinate synthase
MPAVEIPGASRPSTVLIGDAREELSKRLPTGKTIVITDRNVLGLYREELPRCPVLSIGAGEAAKTLATVSDLYDALLDLEAERSSFILGVGGGIVCDVAGFVASTYLRGLEFGFVATTLLAQVDASLGGKNGVNLKGYKNLIGTIRQPRFVICDPRFLSTLPESEAASGLAEVVKHALIADAALFDFIESRPAEVRALAPQAVERMVRDSVRIKLAIVGRDESETGERRMLNFGHSFGHAFEKTAALAHGEAVAAGMALACELSLRRGMLPRRDYERVLRLLETLRLPHSAAADPARVMEAMLRDKKRRAQRIHFVLLEGIGRAAVVELSFSELETLARETVHITAALREGPPV